MRIRELAEEVDMKLADLQTILESLGVPKENLSGQSGIDPAIAAKVREKLSDKNLSETETTKKDGDFITTIPSGKRVIILYSDMASHKLGLKNGSNLSFAQHQLILDADDKYDQAMFNTIMLIGSPDIQIVASVPVSEAENQREIFERKIEGWVHPEGYAGTGNDASPRGCVRLEALFHREERTELASKKDIQVTHLTLKKAALETKSLIQARY